MFITKKFALKKTRIHSDDTSESDPSGVLPWINVKAYAPKGTVYYQMSNGTIGRGARTYNMSERAMKELIESDAHTWVQGKGRVTKSDYEATNVLQFNKKEVTEYNVRTVDFTIDDIPF